MHGIKKGNYGDFKGCNSYPRCKYIYKGVI